VESRPGAAGAIGVEVVAKSAPDGYTLVLSDLGVWVILPVQSDTNSARRSGPTEGRTVRPV